MKTIGIKEFKALVYECLENPDAFAEKSIVLWKASSGDWGIAYRVIEQCCIEHNKKHLDKQVWFERSDYTFDTDEISKMRVCCDREDMYGFKTRGILFNGGPYLTSYQNDWLRFVNTRENKTGHLSKDWVLIACAYGLDESLFSDTCEVYDIQPSLSEWAEWVAHFSSKKVFNPILAYIESNGPIISFDDWQKIMNVLNREVHYSHIESLRQMSEMDFNLAIGGALPNITSLSKELWDFIQAYD